MVAGRKTQIKKSRGVVKHTKLTHKAEKDVKTLQECLRLRNVQTPDNWPPNVTMNLRGVLKLPEGWYHGKKVTNRTGRGMGGKLLPVFVGPTSPDTGKRRIFFHKVDLEKFLGYQIEQPDVIERIRVMNPNLLSRYPDDALLKRTEHKAKSDYINSRCDQLNGKTVREALQEFEYEHQGKLTRYRVTDLQYDQKCGLLVVGDATGKTHSAKTSAKTVQKLKHLQKTQIVPTPKSSSTSSSSRHRSSASTAGAPTAAAASTAGVQEIRLKVFGPLKKCAATGIDGEKDIYTLLGLGHHLGIDCTMLTALREVLCKSPAERGNFGQFVLDSFEAELKKHA